MTRRLLLTGAGGFIGHHVLEHLLHETDWQVVATDSFRHKGKTDRLRQVLESGPLEWCERVQAAMPALAPPVPPKLRHKIGPVDYVIGMASLSHVDNSIHDPVSFVRNNVDIALSTLEYAREARPEHLVWVSTDEVYGPVTGGDTHPPRAAAPPPHPHQSSTAAHD